MFKSILFTCFVLALSFLVIGKPIYVEICNLAKEELAPIINNDKCNLNNYTLLLPANTRVEIIGQSFFCGREKLMFPISVYGIQGDVLLSNLCAIKSEFRGGDKVVVCKGSSLNVYSTPLLYGKPAFTFVQGQFGYVLSDPIYTEQGIYVTKVLVGSSIGWVDTNFICSV
ncbi:predicted protein [Naegleria gruberi]|uniref:Predicted protein n=1 Tax=Naegleria gruberi TaxID=5762 RepID=D2VXL7_NAEGR|nr:uncharacterized protein NAEGRDRAFT_73794 [Naegleria gruberi]EFC38527.1 predicted protein [Naegleria gruberi]|eukprot:XP_002671271.1 predicted protein [Naegleria gruberi strain NEG-M]